MDFKLSIVILNYNVRHFLQLCLESVVKATVNLNCEIIVVDNNSNDKSSLMVKELFPVVNLIENDSNYGFSRANNIGVKNAKGEFICILNPDTVVAEDTFERLLLFARSRADLGIVGCKLINGIGEYLPESKRNIPYPLVALRKILGDPIGYYANHLKNNENGRVDVLVGAFMFMRRELFISANGFDEDFFMYGEDIDLSYRIKKMGFNNYYFGQITAIHFKGESTLKDKFYVKRFFGAMQIFYKKHFKKNLIIDFLIQFGIRLAFLLSKHRIPRKKKVEKYVLISNEISASLNRRLRKLLIVGTIYEDFSNDEELIFDANYISYKDIINTMCQKRGNGLTFKIWPSKSNFIIGSDSAISKGEIIEF